MCAHNNHPRNAVARRTLLFGSTLMTTLAGSIIPVHGAFSTRANTAALSCPPAITVEEEQELRRSILLSSNVVPALSVTDYLNRIAAARTQAWQDIRNSIEGGRYRQLSDSLVLSPFDDVRQCAFYLPWCDTMRRRDHLTVKTTGPCCKTIWVQPCVPVRPTLSSKTAWCSLTTHW